jgi:hypothetical protein
MFCFANFASGISCLKNFLLNNSNLPEILQFLNSLLQLKSPHMLHSADASGAQKEVLVTSKL